MNANEHILVGAPVGLLYATSRPGQTEDYGALIENISGLVGGGFGALLPDILEPAYRNPRHRDFAHSGLFGGGLVAANKKLEAFQTACRRKALEYRTRREQTESGLEKFLCLMGEIICFAVAGLMAGILAGYLSHLVLDLLTPAGLPLVVNGF